MSIALQIYWMLARIILVVESAPKFGDPFFEPLILETSDDYLSNEIKAHYRRKNMEPEIVEKQLDGYVYNENSCKEINGMILCGYDKNKGELIDPERFVDIGDGCRTRGERIECGYEIGPFNKDIKRPDIRIKNKIYNFSQKNAALTRQTPTRTPVADKMTSQKPYLSAEFFRDGSILPINGKSVSLTLSNEPITSTPKTSPVPEQTTLSAETQTLPTVIVELIPTIYSTSSTPAIISTTDIPTISTPESIKTTVSHEDAVKRIEHLDRRSEYVEASYSKGRRLSDVFSALSSSNIETKPNVVSTDPPIPNTETRSDGIPQVEPTNSEKFSTACVEKDNRIICYNFKT